MIVAIQDANIIIDLLEIDLFQQIFQLKIKFHTTDFVLDEINEVQLKEVSTVIEKNLLLVNDANEKEILEILELNKSNRSLSVADCSVIVFAKKMEATLLTGDRYMRKYANRNKLQVHGILWIFDQLVLNDIISKNEAIKQLEILMTKNKRLPVAECISRLKQWSSKRHEK